MNFVGARTRDLQRFLLWLFADFEISGLEHVPTTGNLIVVSNHVSNVDPSMIGRSIPRPTYFLAKDGIFKGALARWFLKGYGAFPLNREGADVRAFRWALDTLAHGNVLVVFPEGTRSGGALKEALPGAVRIALSSSAPILPVGIAGTERFSAFVRVFYPTGKIRVNIGEVFTLPPVEGRPSREVQSSATDMIMGRIRDLLPERYHGVYAGARGETAEAPGS